jgi:hypothetical protein
VAFFRGDNGPELPDWGPAYLRIYEAVELTGWTIEQIQSTPAIQLDHLLTIYRAKQRVTMPLPVRLYE